MPRHETPLEDRVADLEQQVEQLRDEVDRRLSAIEDQLRALRERVDSSVVEALDEVRRKIRKRGDAPAREGAAKRAAGE